MTAKILAFPSGKQIPALSKEQKEPVSTQIEKQQTKKYADAVADDIMIQLIGTLQNEGKKKYSVIDYSGKEIVSKEQDMEIEFEGEEIDNDIDRLQPDSDK